MSPGQTQNHALMHFYAASILFPNTMYTLSHTHWLGTCPGCDRSIFGKQRALRSVAGGILHWTDHKPGKISLKPSAEYTRILCLSAVYLESSVWCV